MTQDRSRKLRRRGQAMVEFTFVGIPMIFVLISVFEISRGMWNYHTLAYAAKSGVRYAVVHGRSCGPPSANTCLKSVGQIAQVIKDAGVGLDVANTSITFYAVDSFGAVRDTVGPCTLTTCLANNSQWPSVAFSQKGDLIRIDVTTLFRSAIAMLWPGATPVSFGAANLAASSTDAMQF